MIKKLLTILLLTVISSSCITKGYKGYVSHYWTAFVIEKTEFEGGTSYYKHYLTPEFNNKSDCIAYTQEYTETPEMEKRYPIYGEPKEVWFMGCDKNW